MPISNIKIIEKGAQWNFAMSAILRRYATAAVVICFFRNKLETNRMHPKKVLIL